MKPRHFAALGLGLGVAALSPFAWSADVTSAYVITSPPATVQVAPADEFVLVPRDRIVEDVVVAPVERREVYVVPADSYAVRPYGYIIEEPLAYPRHSDHASRETNGIIDDGLFNKRGPNDFGS